MRSHVWAWWPDGRVLRLSLEHGAWMQASVHPDGERAVFWGGADDAPPWLWVSPTDRSAPQPITDDRSGARHGTFGLGGDRIVFSSDRAYGRPPARMAEEGPACAPPSGHWNIFTARDDGSDVRQVTYGAVVSSPQRGADLRRGRDDGADAPGVGQVRPARSTSHQASATPTAAAPMPATHESMT